MSQNRRGLTLLEMIISLVILSGAVAVLVGLSRTGSINAASARDTTQAQLLCESLMSQVETGIIPLEPVFEQPVNDFPDSGAINTYNANDYKWIYSLEVNTLDENGLLEIIVTVSQFQSAPPQTASAKRPVSCRLVRWMLDKATAKEMQQENQSQSTTTQSTSSQSTTTQNTSSQNTTTQRTASP
ncbi:MAG: type II secretion system GspH family protein [Planctomycetaceae bacterium]|nr:type II secretion system GspH family protein [Planctomycetaceae bacterium]